MRNFWNINIPASITAVSLALLCLSPSDAKAQAAANTATNAPGFAKPDWLKEMSVTVKEGYDDNVYLSGVKQSLLPPGEYSLKGRYSWLTTVSPRLGFDFVPLTGNPQTFQTLSLGYVPDYVIYENAGSETYYAHRFPVAVKIAQDAFSFRLDDDFAYVQGPRFAVSYPNTLLNAYANVVTRERREQIQDRGKIAFQFDSENWFVRPTAAVLYYDMMDVQHPTTTAEGYMNHCDRYDVNGGMDLGYKITPQVAVTLGYRYGYQYQQQFFFDTNSSPSHYQRVLAGLEGTIGSWLKFFGQFGPDFRDYPGDTPTHNTPVDDRHPVDYYGEAGFSATFTPKDTLTFNYKAFQWVSSLGKIPSYDSSYDLLYRRVLTDKLSMNLGARLLNSDYNSANLPSSLRSDWMDTFVAGLNYDITKNLSVNAGYAVDLGYSTQPDVTNPQTREFKRDVTSVGLRWKF
jgi:hypothetical protein